MTIHGLTGHNLSFSVSIRKDIRDFHYQCNLDAMNVYNKSIDVLLSKGLFDSPLVLLFQIQMNSFPMLVMQLI